MNQNSLSAFIPWLNLWIFTFFLSLQKSLCVDKHYEACVPKHCGDGHDISYPFYIHGQQEPFCGYPRFELFCGNSGHPILNLNRNEYVVENIYYNNQSLRVIDTAARSSNGRCLPPIWNLTLYGDRFQFVNDSRLYLFSNCSLPPSGNLSRYVVGCDIENGGNWGLAMFADDQNLAFALEECNAHVEAPVEMYGDSERNGRVGDYEELLRRGFMLKWRAGNCTVCKESGGRCGFDFDEYQFKCFCRDMPHADFCRSEKSHTKLILATAIPGSAFVLTTCLVIYIIGYRNKWKYFPTYYLSRNISSDPSSKSDLEGGRVFFGVPVFSYSELEEATDNFDESKELGDGGFGTVYYGKLQDGREVAVKRLYEHNYKRVEQFMNEIKILTCLRHKNLVSLYGCTSCRSRELLLVYEYISNGTVADHLHGDRAKAGLLTWPIRMKIARETADALAYLHASDIIHRDVKTNNILLDNNFCVKVADFGLSRLFPIDVTHVSTAPQGTPGYVDPEYHQCYQLTDKSDVYSFGVVLIELISSMQAVDISRHRHEINLANLAINKIQRCAFNELIDPWLGYQSDATIERMTTSVAELAFRCLQHEKEMRPTMDEVSEALKEIQGEDPNFEMTEEANNVGMVEFVRPPPSPASEDDVLLKNIKLPPSPNSVTDKWVSSSSTSASR